MEELSVKDKELIRDSWESLGKNKVPHGVIMFTRLFELDPELLNLFKYSTNCGSKQDCLSSPEFIGHVTKVMLVIDAAVSHLDDLHSLEEFLLNLGKKHQAVGVSTQSFAVGQAPLEEHLHTWLHNSLPSPSASQRKHISPIAGPLCQSAGASLLTPPTLMGTFTSAHV
uniref:Nitrite reductase n=1 Tax=Kryptolebias marmoratus TaxID=37003 RepID=A0A3Q2ZM43_KRYMA